MAFSYAARYSGEYDKAPYSYVINALDVGGSVSVTLPPVKFAGKIAGSVVENPHVGKRIGWNSLLPPTGAWTDFDQAKYDSVKSVDGNLAVQGTGTNGYMAQNLYSFDVVKIIGNAFDSMIWQGKTTLADKIVISKGILKGLTFNGYGWGSNNAGSKMTVNIWRTSAWGTPPVSHTVGSVTKLSYTASNVTDIDAGGYVHFNMYAEPSNGTVSSLLNVDMVELVVEVKL